MFSQHGYGQQTVVQHGGQVAPPPPPPSGFGQSGGQQGWWQQNASQIPPPPPRGVQYGVGSFQHAGHTMRNLQRAPHPLTSHQAVAGAPMGSIPQGKLRNVQIPVAPSWKECTHETRRILVKVMLGDVEGVTPAHMDQVFDLVNTFGRTAKDYQGEDGSKRKEIMQNREKRKIADEFVNIIEKTFALRDDKTPVVFGLNSDLSVSTLLSATRLTRSS